MQLESAFALPKEIPAKQAGTSLGILYLKKIV